MLKLFIIFTISSSLYASPIMIFGRNHKDYQGRDLVNTELRNLIVNQGLDCIALELPQKLFQPAFDKTKLSDFYNLSNYLKRLKKNISFPRYNPLRNMTRKQFERLFFGPKDFELYKKYGVKLMAVDLDMDKDYHTNRPHLTGRYNAAYEVEHTMSKRNLGIAFNLASTYFKGSCKQIALVIGYAHLIEKSLVEKTQIRATPIQILLEKQFKVANHSLVVMKNKASKIPWNSYYRLDKSGAIFYQSKEFVDQVIFY